MFAKQCGIFFSYQHDLGLVLKYLGLLEGLYPHIVYLVLYAFLCTLNWSRLPALDLDSTRYTY